MDGNLNLRDLFEEYHRKYAVSTPSDLQDVPILVATELFRKALDGQRYTVWGSSDPIDCQSGVYRGFASRFRNTGYNIPTIANVLRQRLESSARVEKNRVKASL